jgi:hypothetical protein
MEVTKKIENTSDVAKTILELSERRKNWEAGAYAASNSALYAILGRTLDLLYRVKHYTELSRGLNAMLKKAGFKFNAGTSVEVKLLRSIFTAPAQPNQYEHRIYGYARVLSVAHEAKITGAQLSAFIAEKGGIDEIRRHTSNATSKTDKEAQIHAAEEALNAASFAPIAADFKLTDALQPADGQYFSLALVRKNADGTGSIVFGTNNPALVTSVLGIAGRQIDAAEVTERDRIKAAEAAAKRQADIDAIAAALSEAAGCVDAVTAEDAAFA